MATEEGRAKHGERSPLVVRVGVWYLGPDDNVEGGRSGKA